MTENTQSQEKAIIFSDIDESSIELPSEQKPSKTEEEKEPQPEGDLEEDDVIKEDDISEEKDVDTAKKRLGEDELTEDEEDTEEDDEEKDDDEDTSEDDTAEEEYTEMSSGKLAEVLSKLPPKDLEKVLGSLEVPVKVDGEITKVNLGELKRSYASKEATTKEFYKVREWRDKIRTQLAEINEAIGPGWKALKEKKLEDAFIHFAKLAGFSKLEIKRRLREELAEGIIKYAQMTPEQRKQFDLEEEVLFNREAEQERKEREEKIRQATEREQARYRFQAQYGISDGEYEEATSWLLKNRFNGDGSRLTSDSILEYVVTAKAIDTALALIEREKPSLSKNEAFTDRVIRLCKKYPGASWSQLAKKVQAIAGEYTPKKEEKDERELQKDMSRKILKTRSKSTLQTPPKQKRAMTFDDILP